MCFIDVDIDERKSKAEHGKNCEYGKKYKNKTIQLSKKIKKNRLEYID